MKSIHQAKSDLDKIIKKARVHLYKPIQIAEILFRHRTAGDIDLDSLETYRTRSRKWRDVVCIQFLGRTSTSSARYQDDVFNANAVPPESLVTLGKFNREFGGVVEAYIYGLFAKRHLRMNEALQYATQVNASDFSLTVFLSSFRADPGLSRSVDKIYEIVVYSLFSVLVEAFEVFITLEFNENSVNQMFDSFGDFAEKVIGMDPNKPHDRRPAKLYRVGVTNAADRGLDMWANFGPAIQIKHLDLSQSLANDIANTVAAERIVIVCRDADIEVTRNVMGQLGYSSRIQSIVSESDLIRWYDEATKGQFSGTIGPRILECITNELQAEFPSTRAEEWQEFWETRGYHKLSHNSWDYSQDFFD